MKRVRRIFWIAFLLLLLSGCSSRHWIKPDSTVDQLKKDTYECERDANAIFPGVGLISSIKRSYRFDDCMESKGYVRQW
jgi:PBP1b-binding outer membrane lipoprotein LpoB